MVQKRKKRKDHKNGLTHERILDEAEILFARKGYHAVSILAMVLYFNFARHLIARFTRGQYNADFTSRLVQHIVKFSLNGIGGDDRETLK